MSEENKEEFNKIIKRALGLSIEEIQTMSPQEELDYIEQNAGFRPTINSKTDYTPKGRSSNDNIKILSYRSPNNRRFKR